MGCPVGRNPGRRPSPATPGSGPPIGGRRVEPEERRRPDLLLEQPVNTLPSVGRVDWNPLRRSSLAGLIVWWWC